VYVFAHLGEPGYVLSLAPAAAILIAVAIVELRDDMALLAAVLRARGWRWLPSPRVVGLATAGLLSLGIVGWNLQAFARGVGPGRLPDLRAHDATTAAQVEFLKQQPVDSTFVLAHDIFRQLRYYAPEYHADLLFSEYVPDFQTAHSRTDLPTGTLRDQPQVSVWLVNAEGARAVEHGYQYLRLIL
jgi:hypothetical protein